MIDFFDRIMDHELSEKAKENRTKEKMWGEWHPLSYEQPEKDIHIVLPSDKADSRRLFVATYLYHEKYYSPSESKTDIIAEKTDIVEKILNVCKRSTYAVRYDYGCVKAINDSDGSVAGYDALLRCKPMMTLADYYKKIDRKAAPDEENLIKNMKNLIYALREFYRQGLPYGHVTPENICVTDKGEYFLNIPMRSWFLETGAEDRKSYGIYSAPEIIKDQELPFNQQADIYSLGLIMYADLNNGSLPFSGNGASENKAAQIRNKGEHDIALPAYGSTRLQYIIRKACAVNCSVRYSGFDEMLEDIKKIGAFIDPDDPINDPMSVITTESLERKEPLPAPETKPEPEVKHEKVQQNDSEITMLQQSWNRPTPNPAPITTPTPAPAPKPASVSAPAPDPISAPVPAQKKKKNILPIIAVPIMVVAVGGGVVMLMSSKTEKSKVFSPSHSSSSDSSDFSLIDYDRFEDSYTENEWASTYSDELYKFKASSDFVGTSDGSMYDLCDVNKDGIPELFISTSEYPDALCSIYTYDNNKIVQILSLNTQNGELLVDTENHQIIHHYEHTGQSSNEMNVYEMDGTALSTFIRFSDNFIGSSYQPLTCFIDDKSVDENEYIEKYNEYTNKDYYCIGRRFSFDEISEASVSLNKFESPSSSIASVSVLDSPYTPIYSEGDPIEAAPAKESASDKNKRARSTYYSFKSIFDEYDVPFGFLADLDTDGIDEMYIAERNPGENILMLNVISCADDLECVTHYDIPENSDYYLVSGNGGKKYIYYRYDTSSHSRQGYFSLDNNVDIAVDIDYTEKSGEVKAEWEISIFNETKKVDTLEGNEAVSKMLDQPSGAHEVLLNTLSEYGYNITDSSKYDHIKTVEYSKLMDILADT